jgi:hypothetical protein
LVSLPHDDGRVPVMVFSFRKLAAHEEFTSARSVCARSAGLSCATHRNTRLFRLPRESGSVPVRWLEVNRLRKGVQSVSAAY